ncbi:hypothetical protein SAMN05421747_1304 [Parapedobacter composti]|uniref:Lipocalin-like domain-containing protein n=1 Tax=Parapedobacter composti TaxID=623281 RepID=A0A1I1M857_9SPHI|nr:hypothetical protein [Parapedobacter composti]SFC81226.1 hypothetical protein SAMN05421747_1304 [Parapedobacter composti]
MLTKRWLILVYAALFTLNIMGFAWMINAATNPEKAILGQWKEAGWHYERVNSKTDTLRKEVYYRAGNEPVVHKAETWSFLPDGTLVLNREHGEETASWCIKGRGNILELKYNDGRKEHYDLTTLSDDSMTLNFELDTQIKGLAKLTFDRLM